jgi:hypothetical protein
VARRRVGQGDERTCWKLEKRMCVSGGGNERKERHDADERKQSDIDGQDMTLTGHDACRIRCDTMRCDAAASARACVSV